MSRFFTDTIQSNEITIRGDDAKHIVNVLRLSNGDTITLCDGNGKECEAHITSVGNNTVTIAPHEIVDSNSEPDYHITIFQCLPKTGKMEMVIQKGTELGMHSLCPVYSSRCVVQPGKDYDKKLDRYKKVATEAAMQSRRGRIPQILPLKKLSELNFDSYDTVLLAYEEEKTTSLKKALVDAGINIALIIGPEGGFSPDEVSLLSTKGAVSISLGKRILRTETAGPATVAQILFALED